MEQFFQYYEMLIQWNEVMNLTAITEMDQVVTKHFVDSMSLVKAVSELGSKEIRIMDLGTGGGFPGIPLAILFPEVTFHLVDSIGKKVRVATEVANAIGLKNVTFRHARAEEEKRTFDFVVSRAVMPLADLIKIIKKNISSKQQNALPNGLICLKGGELEHETMPFKHKTVIHNLSDSFEEEFFQTKKVVYVPI